MNRVAKYELLELLGKGGMGEVWKARDTGLGRTVALKLMQRTDAEDLARFRREAHVVAKLNHPNIAQLYEFGDDPPHLAMQFVEGGPLSKPEHLAAAARAVHYAHTQGVLHRDLKPANIMADVAGRAFVLDFGLAREVKGEQTAMSMSGDILGTPSYMSPEQARGEVHKLDARTDVYGLGATLYHLIAGRPPHAGPTAFDVIRKVLDEDPLPSGGDRDLELIALKAMEKDPTRRYVSADEFADDLDRYLRKEPIQARPASTLYRLKKKIQKEPVLWGLSVTLVFSIILGAGIAIGQLVRAIHERDRRLQVEESRTKDYEARERARAHLDAARRLVVRLEEFHRSQTPDPIEPAIEKEALVRLSDALKEYPNLPEAYLERGRLHSLLGRKEEALHDLDRAIALSPKLATARLERSLLNLEAYDDLRHEFSGKLREETAEAAALRGAIEEDLDRVREWSKDYGDLKLAEGLKIFTEGNYGRAVEVFSLYVRWNPRDAAGRYWRGHALYHLKRYPEAEQSLTGAIALRPREIRSRVNRGAVYHDLQRYDEALSDFGSALSIDPNDAATYNNRGSVYQALQRYTEALSDFGSALSIQPKSAEVYNNRGLVYCALRRYDDALSDFGSALSINPKFALAYNNRGPVYEALQRNDEALSDYGAALSIDPKFATAYYNRGMLYFDLRRYEEALSDYGSALSIDPKYPEAYNNRGLVYEALKRYKEAAAEFEAALRVAPEGWSYRAMVERNLEEMKKKPAESDY